MDIGLPATIYRPSIVVGDSRTGVTQKYDGPYYIIRWILRQKRFVHIPVVADPRSVHFNVVPRDFVVDAIAHLSGEPRAIGKTYGDLSRHMERFMQFSERADEGVTA